MQTWDQRHRTEIAEKDKTIEALQQELMISGKGGSPGQPYDEPKGPKPNEPYVPSPGRSLTIAHGEGRGPQPKYHDEYNRELPIPPWMQMDPSGKLIEIPWMKEQYMREHPELGLQISGIPEYDQFMQNMRRGSQNPKSGSINHHPPHIQKLILGIRKRIRA